VDEVQRYRLLYHGQEAHQAGEETLQLDRQDKTGLFRSQIGLNMIIQDHTGSQTGLNMIIQVIQITDRIRQGLIRSRQN
jgi:hypothetical protein